MWFPLQPRPFLCRNIHREGGVSIDERGTIREVGVSEPEIENGRSLSTHLEQSDRPSV